MRNYLKGHNGRFEMAKETISKFEGQSIEIT